MTCSVDPTDSNLRQDDLSMLKGADVRVNRGQALEIYRKRRRDVGLAMTTFNLASSIPRPLNPRASTRAQHGSVYVEDIQLHSLDNELKT
jgi:hypothetical protein